MSIIIKIINLKKISNKRGVVLAYVIGISAAILVLAAALFSMSAYNLTASHKASDSRQAYLTARSAIEFAKGEISKLATLPKSGINNDVNSIQNGVKQKTFYVKKTGVNDLSIADNKPTEKEFAAQCNFKLVKTQHFAEVKFRVWEEKRNSPMREITDFTYTNSKVTPPINWKVTDNKQLYEVMNKNDEPKYKPFPFEEILAAKAATIEGYNLAYRMSIDRYTIYTYEVAVNANVLYNSSKFSEPLTYNCVVQPGFGVLHEVKSSKPDKSQFVVAGAQYGDNVLMDGSAYNKDIAPSPSGNEPKTSDFPVVFPLGFRLNDINQTFAAPSVFVMEELVGGVTSGNTNPYTFETDFLYIDTDLSNFKNDTTPLYLKKRSATKAIVCFKDTYYWVKSDTVNLFKPQGGDLTELTPQEIKTAAQIPKTLLADVKTNYSNMITGDKTKDNRGTNWTIDGKFDGTKTPPSVANGKHVNWYIKNSANWGNSLNATQNVYQAAKINLQGDGLTLTVPTQKPIFLNADAISIAGIEEIKDENSSDKHPTRFPSLTLQGGCTLTVSDPIRVIGNHPGTPAPIFVSYTIQPGIYTIPNGGFNLFSNEAKNAFRESLGGNGTGGGEIPSGQNEEKPGITVASPRDKKLTEVGYEK